jgi:hypothetical protein
VSFHSAVISNVSDRAFEPPPVTNRTVEQWILTVTGEYLEIPGLMLTRRQIQRFWDLDTALCDTILETLVGRRFLQRTGEGGFQRLPG